jgi:osmotically-inducible protein OsmY
MPDEDPAPEIRQRSSRATAAEAGRQHAKERIMPTLTMAGTDLDLRDRVQRQLEFDPEVEEANIAVSASEGVVTLAGFARTYAAKLAAEKAAKRVYGVRGIANDVEVKLLVERTDPDIAHEAVNALQNRLGIGNNVTVTVRNGFVILEGAVDWLFQRGAAESAVRYLRGVRGVQNDVVIRPPVRASETVVKHAIEEALRRTAEVDARRIHVAVKAGTVKLSGTVRSWLEREEAERAAARAQGVTKVENQIQF